MKEIPELYEIAKKITLDAGFPYTDPRTMETTQPMKNNKIPKWILLDQWHVDLQIKSDMPAEKRRKLRKNIEATLASILNTNQPEFKLKLSK